MIRKTHKNKVKPLSLKSLKDKAWSLMSISVRSKHADWRGNVRCYTCGITKHWRQLQAGHFWHGKLDFDERNIHPQCKRCNKFLRGNLDNYSMNLIEEIGLEAVKQLRRDAARHPGYSRLELIEIIERLKKCGSPDA